MSFRNNKSSSGEVSDSEEEFSAKLARLDNSASIRQKRKRFNDIWRNVTENNVLSEALSEADVKSSSCILINHGVESYCIQNSHSDPDGNDSSEEVSQREDPKKRLSAREYDKRVSRKHYGVDFESGEDEIVIAILKVLGESKIDLIDNVVKVLGKKRALEFCYLAEDVEAAGGFFVVDGSRRRTPGGVYFTLIRQSNEISKAEKKILFKESRKEILSRKRKRNTERRRERMRAIKLQSNVETVYPMYEDLPSPDVFIEAPED